MKNRIREGIAFVLWLVLFAVICRIFVYGMEQQGYEYIPPIANNDTQENIQDPIAWEQEGEEETEEQKKEKEKNRKKSEKKQKKKKEALKKARKVSFEKSLEKFPSSYHSALKALHEKHPNWHFEAVNTAVTWDKALDNESQVGKNSIEINPYTHLSYVSMEPGAYNQADDSFTAVDAGGRYTPSKAVVAYYMDPRNFLTEAGIFQFEDLSYNQYHEQKVVQKILNSTFMKGSYTCIITNKKGKKSTFTQSYAETFMTAGKKAGVNPYHLASRVIQEVGSQGSASVSGKSGYYNFFNVAAGDSPGGGAVAKGLAYAAGSGSYYRPWNNPYRAILGGSQFLGEEYINEGQDTLYFQKWSVVNGDKLFWHQYMSNVQAPTSEASIMYQAYKDVNCLEEEFVFRIPVYSNMPNTVCKLPGKILNPNHYLRSIKVTADGKALSFSPKFTYETTSYAVRVSKDTKKVTIAAKPVSSYASVQGNGSKALRLGTNVVSLTCVAQDGSRLTYRIHIIREKGETNSGSQEKTERPTKRPTEQKTEKKTQEKTDAATREPGTTQEATESELPEKTEVFSTSEEGEKENGTDGEYAKQSNSVCYGGTHGGETQGEQSSVYRASHGGSSDSIQNNAAGGTDGGSITP